MHSQFIRELIKIIHLFYNDNIIDIRKERRAKKSFEVFVKHISILSLIVILKKINLFSNYLKSLSESLFNHRYFSFL